MFVDGNRLIPPTPLIPSIQEEIHECHPGVVKSLTIARKRFFWQNMKKDIHTFVANCRICLPFLNSKMPARGNGNAPEVTEPMEALSMDLFKLEDTDYLAIADLYTGYAWGVELYKTDMSNIIKVLKSICDVYGYPKSIRCDGCPQFRTEFI